MNGNGGFSASRAAYMFDYTSIYYQQQRMELVQYYREQYLF